MSTCVKTSIGKRKRQHYYTAILATPPHSGEWTECQAQCGSKPPQLATSMVDLIHRRWVRRTVSWLLTAVLPDILGFPRDQWMPGDALSKI